MTLMHCSRIKCPFYHKIGVCRHGTDCLRVHEKPTVSDCLLIRNMYYQTPPNDSSGQLADDVEDFEEFYEDVFSVLSNYGKIEFMEVCESAADFMRGNTYVRFAREEDAASALRGITGRFYAGRPVLAEFSPVTDLREACCRQFAAGECSRGGHCSFLHLIQISPALRQKLYGTQERG